MRFVTSDAKTLHLKNGKDWIEVKKELSYAEDRKYRVAGMGGVTRPSVEVDGKVQEVKIDIDWGLMAVARVEAYLTAWSDKKPVSRAAIEALCKEDFEEIDGLIQKHIEETDAEKKAQTSSETST